MTEDAKAKPEANTHAMHIMFGNMIGVLGRLTP